MITASTSKSLSERLIVASLAPSPLPSSIVSCADQTTRPDISARLFTPLLFGLGAVAIYLIPGANESLQFDRGAIRSGQWWRLLTGHWTHWSFSHLFWDTAVFVILSACGAGFPARVTAPTCLTSPTRPTGPTAPFATPFLFLPAFLLLSSLFISSAVWFLAPEMTTYRGLSGIDSALFVWVAIRIAQEQFRCSEWMRLSIVAAVLAGFCFKVSFEYITGATLFVQSDGVMTPAPLAHVAGAAIAILWITIYQKS